MESIVQLSPIYIQKKEKINVRSGDYSTIFTITHKNNYVSSGEMGLILRKTSLSHNRMKFFRQCVYNNCNTYKKVILLLKVEYLSLTARCAPTFFNH